MTMKRIIFAMLVFILISFFVACGNATDVSGDIESHYSTENNSYTKTSSEATSLEITYSETTSSAEVLDSTSEEAVFSTETNSSSASVMVWIPETGTKYHSNSSCSGMKNPTQVTKEQAIGLGYDPCSRCH